MKSEVKQKRRAILQQIDRLEKNRCIVCIGGTANTKEINCQCEAAVEIRKLGAEYEAVAKSSRKNRIQALIGQIQKNGISKELYLNLRELDMTSKEIQKVSGLGQLEFHIWKQNENLTHASRAGNIEDNAPAKRHKKTIDATYLEIARKNGIPEHIVYSRFFDKGWDIKRAVTAKSRQKNEEALKWKNIAVENGINPGTFYKRIQNGMAMEMAATVKSDQRRTVKA